MWGSGGTLGSGPAIYGTSGFPSVGDGFIDGNRLVVAVEMGAQLDDQGVVMGIDLTTGDRTILSGKVEDPAKGPVVVGSGPDLGGIRSVTQAGSAWMALASTGARQPVSVIRIDPKTGTRTLERKIEKGLTCTGNGTKLFVDFDGGIAAGADGTVYVAAGNPGSKLVGIVALKGNSCDVVTMSGGGGSDSKGAGPTVESMDGYRALKLDGGKLWALHGMTNSLFTIDILTGNRARVSSGEPSTKVGAGEKLGYQRIALAGSRIWTAGPWAGNGFVLTEASASNGQRTGRDATSGPASYGDEPKGVWVHPTKPLLVLSIDKAFVFFDPATGQSSTFSQ